MRTIYRYELAIKDRPMVDMPRGAVVLPVPPCARNRDSIEIWALVDPEAPPVSRSFRIVGTGNPMPEVCGPFVGTVMTHGGMYVWHVFEAEPVIRPIPPENPDGTWK